MRSIIQGMSAALSRVASRWIPDPLVIALLLSGIVLLWSALGTELGFWGTIDAWGGRHPSGLSPKYGVWKLLGFAMQMCLVLVTGHALAAAPWAQRVIRRLTSIPGSATQAIIFTAYIAMIGGLLNWGLGLILGAMTAREMGKSCAQRGVPVHYPLICAAGYTGLLVWHGGLSGTAPLKVTRAGELVDVFGEAFVREHELTPISLYDTLGSALNLWVMGGLLFVVPLALAAMLPRDKSSYISPPSELDSDASEQRKYHGAEVKTDVASSREREGVGIAQRLERSRLIAYLFAALIFAYTYRYLRLIGFGQIDLNVINLIFVGLGLVAYGAPTAYGQAIERAARGCAGILIQFPLYAGVMAVMSTSGITQAIARGFTQLADADSMSTFSFFSAGLINLFVPSGGGQWAVQGPLLLESAYQVGAPLNEVVMAFAYGDAWTNMLQPFWALPLLVLTGVKARDIVGYTATLMLMVTPIYVLGFWIL